ncbi:hypothetical protein [Streptomyces sp. NPDC002467]|uniref:hypothetical protein n=1 Tax=Streptomyces sp. NPDC002467 TaxID=3364647 RepID=UPI0036749C66
MAVVVRDADALDHGDDPAGDGGHEVRRAETAVHVAYVPGQVVEAGDGPQPADAEQRPRPAPVDRDDDHHTGVDKEDREVRPAEPAPAFPELPENRKA